MSITQTAYPSLEAAKAAANDMAKTQGFALATRTSKMDGAGVVKYLILRCSKAGQFRQDPNVLSTHETKRRCRKTSQKTGCKLTVITSYNGALNKWLVRMPSGSGHNHALLPPQAHTKYRIEAVTARLGDIVALYNDGIALVDIAARLRAAAAPDDDIATITSQDVRNARSRHRRDEEMAYTP
ncbi:hypothetical protein JDV02_000617 [Purpureocillium takamizusanense]|uniref:FAR1 domain-containing protein n=1 Tax=Purpureocillium takamizusanense TaxID=2060973 RepID=A0A9Q8Q599_9HYPO|nr:uncharacterized protein JDV02_000617 [Purpureocillium takamizusanense]UNI13928.1 hypothetical protein JDV02_000617 [Purpureocillium takamizusanense]